MIAVDYDESRSSVLCFSLFVPRSRRDLKSIGERQTWKGRESVRQSALTQQRTKSFNFIRNKLNVGLKNRNSKTLLFTCLCCVCVCVFLSSFVGRAKP